MQNSYVRLNIGDLTFDSGQIDTHFPDHTAARNIVVDLCLQLPQALIGNGLFSDYPSDQFDPGHKDPDAVRQHSRQKTPFSE
jgi:hypothetical protein